MRLRVWSPALLKKEVSMEGHSFQRFHCGTQSSWAEAIVKAKRAAWWACGCRLDAGHAWSPRTGGLPGVSTVALAFFLESPTVCLLFVLGLHLSFRISSVKGIEKGDSFWCFCDKFSYGPLVKMFRICLFICFHSYICPCISGITDMHHYICLILLRWGSSLIFSNGLALNHDSPNLCLPGS
jgi:hypothetical protein